MTAYTNRGTKWEWAASWWILLTIVPFGLTSFIGFIYAGSATGNRRWTMYGYVYLAAVIVAMLTTAVGIGAFIAVAVWVISIIHAFKIRPAFLIQLDMRIRNKKALNEQRVSQLRQEAESLLKVQDQVPPVKKPVSNSYSKETDSEKVRNELHDTLDSLSRRPPLGNPVDSLAGKVQSAAKVRPKIDANRASEAELASVPEIGIILAKKIVLKREEIGGFVSFEQFLQSITLRKQAAAKLEEQLMFVPIESPQTDRELKQGRMIDF
ncbi:helix-hairpin-helix domain-containing protein [Saccharibacillus qingshengii]|uniref:helix-hairpin-helix domain-containing protein n=1 Tax=Saccharibacillus qingshengii TaxID=1763540 RepID=UPI001551F5C8|nr:helix-hairpin-helix domain-containing protein [Saccharibacillus qingshengii]